MGYLSVTKQLFDKVQKQLEVPPKPWNKKRFPFKSLCICGTCGSKVTAEEKFKKLRYGGVNKHIYYHCGRSKTYDCDEPYINENDLINQLIAHINAGNVKIVKSRIAEKLKEDIQKFHTLRSQVLRKEYLSGNLNKMEDEAIDYKDEETAKDFLKHVLKTGNAEERQEALSMIKTKFTLSRRELKLRV